jgi:hypothetical protein
MQDSHARKQTEWTASKVVTVIGIILLLVVTSYAAYVAIDAQAKESSLVR